MKAHTLVVYSAITLLFLIACNKDNEMVTNAPGKGDGTVSGVVVDKDNNPLGNATVAGGTDTTITDAYGKFTLTKVQFTADSVVLNVLADGYFEGSRSFKSSNNSVRNVKIQLINKPAATAISATGGGNVSVSGGGSVNFNAGFINASTGEGYTGNVLVSTIYLDATDQNFSAAVPGILTGVSVANQQGTLESYGVMAVELNDASGNKLQLAQSSKAMITLPIPVQLQPDAPSSIPLWYFDNSKGWWKQEGRATRQGNNYVGEVSHFSFWSVGDISVSMINLRLVVTIDTGFVYSNKMVKIIRPDSSSTTGNTDSYGVIEGMVPANEELFIQVFNDCGKSVVAKYIGPFSSDASVDVHVANDDCVSTDTTQFIRLTIDNNRNYLWPSSLVRQSFEPGSHTFIMGGKLLNSDTTVEGMIFSGEALPGSYPIAILIVEKGSYNYQAGGMSFDSTYNYPTTVITRYDEIGGYVEGTIAGWIKTFPAISTADSFPLTGSYRLKRIQ